MTVSTARMTVLAGLLLGLILSGQTLARSDDHIQREIEAQLAAAAALDGARISVHVEQRLVVLTGEVHVYEQKLVSERIAWTTPGVFEVDNEIQVKPRIPVSDADIKRQIMERLVRNARYRKADVSVVVDGGRVLLNGHFVEFSDPAALKHEIAGIEGVIDIDVVATFLAGPDTDSGPPA